jgi:transcriptional regulator with XRE-family HTH domain
MRGSLVKRDVRRLKVIKRFSQETFAVDAGIAGTYISYLERSLENSTLLVWNRLAKALEVPITEFFVVPAPNEKPPGTLPSGRKRDRAT